MPVQLGAIADSRNLAGLLHGLIPGELPLSLGPGLLWRMPAGQWIAGLDVARDLRGHAKTYLPAPHLRKRYGSLAPVWLVGQALFAAANLLQRLGEIAVPLHGIHGQVQMSV